MLQCAIPVFEKLLPSLFNKIVLDLLFELATWHGLTKLRMHTDMTLGFLDTSTMHLGQFLQWFIQETEKEYITKDLLSEEAAHSRQKAHKATWGLQVPPNNPGQGNDGPKIWHFNLQTYKLHTLGDYVDTICQFGTTDNYTTQSVSYQRIIDFLSMFSAF